MGVTEENNKDNEPEEYPPEPYLFKLVIILKQITSRDFFLIAGSENKIFISVEGRND